MKAVLVTGSRNWPAYACHPIDMALTLAAPSVVIHGDAKGADTWAAIWCRENGVSVLPMPAQWDRHRKSAGPIRNRNMLEVLRALEECGYKCEVQAFPLGESRGTRGMVEMAEKAGFDVYAHEGSET